MPGETEEKKVGKVGIEIGIQDNMVVMKFLDSDEGSEIEFVLTTDQARGMALGMLLALRKIGGKEGAMASLDDESPN